MLKLGDALVGDEPEMKFEKRSSKELAMHTIRHHKTWRSLFARHNATWGKAQRPLVLAFSSHSLMKVYSPLGRSGQGAKIHIRKTATG